MKSGIKITGLNEIYLALNHAAERVADGARKAMHRGADEIVREAKLNTPVDEHNLEESIRKEVTYGFRGRLVINVIMGGMVNGVNVDNYAVEVHENYSQMKPGPGTVAKRQANPQRYVGEKFLERAGKDVRARLERNAIQVVRREWKL